MSSGMKYIIMERAGMEEAILFPCWWQHNHIARDLKLAPAQIVSAGCIKRNEEGRLYCFGNSVSLDIKHCRPVEDLDLILRQLSFDL